MLLILLGLLLALLPLLMTTAFPHLVIVSIYSGLGFAIAVIWAILVLFLMARKQHIIEWRAARKVRRLEKKASKQLAKQQKSQLPLNQP